jgi:hypothetical protein
VNVNGRSLKVAIANSTFAVLSLLLSAAAETRRRESPQAAHGRLTHSAPAALENLIALRGIKKAPDFSGAFSIL